MPCWAQKSSISWVSGMPPIIEPAIARREVDRRVGVVPNLQRAVVTDAGHMLHHDQPQQVGKLVETFFIG